MPNSFDHCPPCLFGDLARADYVGLEDEMHEVTANLHNIGQATEDTMIPQEQSLSAKQRMTARSCATTIFNGDCEKFEWRPSVNDESEYILAVRGREQAK